MIRDGYILDEKKRIGLRINKPRTKNYTMTFKSLCTLLDHINVTGDYSYLRHIQDPYAMMLLLGVYETVDLPNVLPNDAYFREDLTCQTVWETLKENNPIKLKALMLKADDVGHHYLYFISKGKNVEGISVKRLFREISKVRQTRYNDLYHTWVLQPDPEAMSFSVLSDFTSNDSITPTQRVTPALGRPVRLVYPRGSFYDIRYPCEVVPNFWEKGERVQVHKELDDVVCFNSRNEEINIPSSLDVSKVLVDGLFEGVDLGDSFYFYDILCINDVWIHNKPYKDRIPFLWRFGAYAIPTYTAYSLSNLKDISNLIRLTFDAGVIIYNLNRVYCPVSPDGVIDFGDKVVQLVVKRQVGYQNRFSLKTSDSKVLFDFGPQRISEDSIGKIVDVDMDGNIIRYRFDLREAQPWDDVKVIWGVDELDDVKKIRWRKLGG